MTLTTLQEPDFSFTFPEGAWSNHSTHEAYDFRWGDKEQIMAVLHVPRKALAPLELQEAIIQLFRIRLESVQNYSANSCQFESPTCSESPGSFNALVYGHDLRQRVLMQLGFFGTPHMILVVSYYDYSGSSGPDSFKQRAGALFSSVKVFERA